MYIIKMLARKKARSHPVMGHKRALRYCALRRVYRYIYIPYWGGVRISLQLRVKSL